MVTDLRGRVHEKRGLAIHRPADGDNLLLPSYAHVDHLDLPSLRWFAGKVQTVTAKDKDDLLRPPNRRSDTSPCKTLLHIQPKFVARFSMLFRKTPFSQQWVRASQDIPLAIESESHWRNNRTGCE